MKLLKDEPADLSNDRNPGSESSVRIESWCETCAYKF